MPAVENLTFSGVGSASIDLVWDEAPGVDGYVVYQRDPLGNNIRIALTGTASYSIADLNPDTTYRFAVRSYRIVHDNEVICPDVAWTRITTMTPPVSDLNVVLSVNRPLLTWSASKGAAGYEIWYDSGDGWEPYASTKKARCRGGWLDPCTVYHFAVMTYRTIDGEKTVSTDMTTVVGCTMPDTPSYTVTNTDDTFTLKWKKVDRADAYDIFTKLSGQKWVQRGTVSGTSFTFEEKEPNFYIALRAVKCLDTQRVFGDYHKTYHTDAKLKGALCSFGDSIARGKGSHFYSFGEMYAEKYHWRADNFARNGSNLCVTDNENSICEAVLSQLTADNDYDIILVDGGTNDYTNNCPLGDITPNGTTEFDRNTTCGALETMFTHMRANAPKAKLYFVLIHDVKERATTPNDIGLTYTDYTDKIELICKKYGVTVIDCTDVMHTSDAEVAKQYTYTAFGIWPNGDGLHPTEEAYRLLYLPVIESALNRK